MRPVSNPPNPWASSEVEWLQAPPAARLEVYEERAKSILSKNDSPDLPFRYSVNPYRGCLHGCAYCYARPTHQYLGFGAGTDFDRRIVVKTNAPELLEKESRKAGFEGEMVAFSGNTDCYQALEASYRLTRRCLEVLADRGNPVGLITKSALVTRDIDVLKGMNAIVTLSCAFADDDTARKMEPWAAKPSRRLEALARLSDAGIETAIAISPIIPALNDADIPKLLERAKAAGAKRAWMTLVRLPLEVRTVFEERLVEAFPDRAQRVLHAIDDTRGGKRNEARFGARMHGVGARWSVIEQLFAQHARRLGFALEGENMSPPTEVIQIHRRERPSKATTKRGPSQGELF